MPNVPVALKRVSPPLRLILPVSVFALELRLSVPGPVLVNPSVPASTGLMVVGPLEMLIVGVPLKVSTALFATPSVQS